MITQTQINALKKVAHSEEAILNLLDEYQSEIDFKQVASGKKIKVKILNKNSEIEIVAKNIDNTGLCYHKSASNLYQTITHINTGLALFQGLTSKEVKRVAENISKLPAEILNIFKNQGEFGDFEFLRLFSQEQIEFIKKVK